MLLSNKDGLLPLDKSKLKKIAVIGPHADLFTPGGYSGKADNPVTPLQGIKNRAAQGTEVLYAKGCEMAGMDSASVAVDRETGFSKGAGVKLDAQGEGAFIQFPVEIPAPGTYEIKLHYKSFPNRGIFKLSVDGVDQGQAVDMYSPSASYDHVVSLGTKAFDRAGRRQFRFTVTGKNPASSSYTGHFDQILLTGTSALSLEAEDLRYTSGEPETGDSMAQAAALAKGADVAVVYVGTTNAIEAEGRDRTSLGLPGRQEELVKAVLAANPKTVVVLMNAGPLTVPWIKDHAPAILEAWWNGVEGGNAIADVLFGDVQSRRAPAAHGLCLRGPGAAAGRVRRDQGLHVHVSERRAALCLRPWPELHRVPIRPSADLAQADPGRREGLRERGGREHRKAGRGRGRPALCP